MVHNWQLLDVVLVGLCMVVCGGMEQCCRTVSLGMEQCCRTVSLGMEQCCRENSLGTQHSRTHSEAQGLVQKHAHSLLLVWQWYLLHGMQLPHCT